VTTDNVVFIDPLFKIEHSDTMSGGDQLLIRQDNAFRALFERITLFIILTFIIKITAVFLYLAAENDLGLGFGNSVQKIGCLAGRCFRRE